MQINPKEIKKQFEKNMNTYDEHACVQKLMAQILVEKIAEINSNFENILELGSGTGLLTREIAKKINFKNYLANDIIAKSENYIKKIIPNSTFYLGNAQKIKPSKKVDLIISNAMFQWFENLDTICERCKNNLTTNGLLAFTTFSPNNFKEIKSLTGLSLDYKTIDELKSVFEKDFEIIYTEQFEEKLEFANPLEILAHLKKTGVNSLTHWSFKEVKDFCEKYLKAYSNITLTYSPIIFICKKKGGV